MGTRQGTQVNGRSARQAVLQTCSRSTRALGDASGRAGSEPVIAGDPWETKVRGAVGQDGAVRAGSFAPRRSQASGACSLRIRPRRQRVSEADEQEYRSWKDPGEQAGRAEGEKRSHRRGRCSGTQRPTPASDRAGGRARQELSNATLFIGVERSFEEETGTKRPPALAPG